MVRQMKLKDRLTLRQKMVRVMAEVTVVSFALLAAVVVRIAMSKPWLG